MIQVSLYFSNFTKVLFARRLNVQIFLINDVAFSSDIITDIMARYEQKTEFLDYDASDDDVVGWKCVRGFPANPGLLLVLSLWSEVMNREDHRRAGYVQI